MAKKKPTKKDIEIEMYQLHLRISQINQYMSGIAEILNKYIEFGGKSKEFYDGLKKKVEEIAKDKEGKDGAVGKE